MIEFIESLTPKRIGVIAVCLLVAFGVLVYSPRLIETNHEGYYQVKQAFYSGEMTVRSEPGFYWQNLGYVTTYQKSDMYYFSKSKLDGGTGPESSPIKVRFNDGGTALISGSIKFRLSSSEADQLTLHKDFKNYDAVVHDLIRQVVTESLMQTATLMKAEESYSTRRSEFTSLAEGQIRDGIYATESEEVKERDVEGNDFIKQYVKVKKGNNGMPTIYKISPFRNYKVEVLQFVIKDIDFDPTIDALIAKKKEAEQQQVVARAKAKKAKQDAITEREQGFARIAKAKAEEEVAKIRAVTQAKKAKEVAELNALREYNVANKLAKKSFEVAKIEAEKELTVAKLNKQAASERAKAHLLEGEAAATVAKLKVQAGLTPLQRAEIEKETRIGVARALATIQLPSTFIAGGGGKSGGVDPFAAIGLESLLNIKERMSTSNGTATPKK